MSRSQDPQKPPLPFWNPFRMMISKGSHMSPKLVTLLSNFEQTLATRLIQLQPKDEETVLSLSWMTMAMQSLSQTHSDIKSLITDLELPVIQWEERWVDVYLDNTVKLLDVCTAFRSQISRISQGQLLLKCALCSMDNNCSKDFTKLRSSLESWWHLIASKNLRIDHCCSIMDQLVQSLDLPKIKNSAKGKVLMCAMYGVRVQTVFICSALIAALTGSAEKLTSLQVPGSYSWAEAFTSLQASVNREISEWKGTNILLKELEAVDEKTKELFSLIQKAEGPLEAEPMVECISELHARLEILSIGLDILTKEVDGFFQIVLSGRDALLCNLRASTDPTETSQHHKKELMMR